MPEIQELGAKIVREFQTIMLREWKQEKLAVIPEDLAQKLLVGVSKFQLKIPLFFKIDLVLQRCCPVYINLIQSFQLQATRQMELAELIESKVITLRRDALRVINCCLAGTATHKLFDLLESVFGPDIHLGPSYTGDFRQAADDDECLTGYEEGEDDIPTEEIPPHPEAESKDFQELQKAIEKSIESAADEGEDILSPPPGPVTDPSLGQSSSALPPLKRKAPAVKGAAKRKPPTEVFSLNEAVPFRPTSKATLPYTGIDQKYISGRIQSGSQSIYQCEFNRRCQYRSANHSQLANHLRRMHIGSCIACRLCSKHFWAGKGFEDHVTKSHPDQPQEWYEPEAQLSNVKLETASKID